MLLQEGAHVDVQRRESGTFLLFRKEAWHHMSNDVSFRFSVRRIILIFFCIPVT